jgi:hypothetical protein
VKNSFVKKVAPGTNWLIAKEMNILDFAGQWGNLCWAYQKQAKN